MTSVGIEKQNLKGGEIMFDYSDLLGKIKTVFKTQEAFGEAIGMKLPAVNQRLNNKIDWSTPEIMRACEVLNIDMVDIPKYFFTEKVQKSVQEV